MRHEELLYAQVLLLDGKIENWKICQDKKNHPLEFKARWKGDRIGDYTMETIVYNADEVEVPEGWTFNAYVFNKLGPDWVNQWAYADDYKLARAMSKTLEEHLESVKSIQDALNGRFKILGQLGQN